MGIWEIQATSLDINIGTTRKVSSKGVASDYSKILAEKISNIKADVEAMEEVQDQLDEIEEMQAKLTGDGTSSGITEIETIKRFMPDGSIMVTTYENGEITEQIRHKPHMSVVPDYTAPPKADGSPATELKPYQNLDLEMLLMM